MCPSRSRAWRVLVRVVTTPLICGCQASVIRAIRKLSRICDGVMGRDKDCRCWALLVIGEDSSGGLFRDKGSQDSFRQGLLGCLDWVLGSPGLEAAIDAVNVLEAGIDEILGRSTAGMAMVAIDNQGF